MHSYRRGARTAVAKMRPAPYRKATAEEVNEHGQWRIKRANMDMAQLYLAWAIIDCLAITLFCQIDRRQSLSLLMRYGGESLLFICFSDYMSLSFLYLLQLRSLQQSTEIGVP